MAVVVNMERPKVRSLFCTEDRPYPGSRLPVLWYRGALSFCDSVKLWRRSLRHLVNGWDVQWMGTVQNRLHFHSTAHEALAVADGSAVMRFGGPRRGFRRTVKAGDIIIIPAGVAHAAERTTKTFRVIGMYPAEQYYDMRYGSPNEYEAVCLNIRKLQKPLCDPFFGVDGPLLDHWIVPKEPLQ